MKKIEKDDFDVWMNKQHAIALVLCAAEGLRGDQVAEDVKNAAVEAIRRLNDAFDLKIDEART